MRVHFISMSAALGVALLVSTLPASATGLAWDSVTKFSMGQSAAEPGDFATDFKTASQPAPAAAPGHGMFGGISSMMAAGQMMGHAFMHGFAERRYAAGDLLRVDNLETQTATITDCRARTLTTLNLIDKTYRVESLDSFGRAVSGGSSGSAASSPAPAPQDNTKTNIVITTTALGDKQFGPLRASGYQSDMKITITPDNGASKTVDMTMTGYYTATPEPAQSCYHATVNAEMGRAAMGMGTGMMQHIMQAMRTPKGDSRFSMSSSGPALPVGRLSLFTIFAPQSKNGGFSIINENGDVRPIDDHDPAFSVPAGFTKEQ